MNAAFQAKSKNIGGHCTFINNVSLRTPTTYVNGDEWHTICRLFYKECCCSFSNLKLDVNSFTTFFSSKQKPCQSSSITQMSKCTFGYHTSPSSVPSISSSSDSMLSLIGNLPKSIPSPALPLLSDSFSVSLFFSSI